MELDESAFWIDGLFPGEVTIEQIGDVHVAIFSDGAQYIASTVDFQQVDIGLESYGVDIRVEMFAVATQVEGLAEFVSETARLVQLMGVAPQPGEVVPGTGALTQQGLSTQHSLLVVPFPWGGDVPHFQGEDYTTVMLQILPITDDELDYLQSYGVEELQKALVDQQIDILDLRR